ncbi:MAG: hypothetical protein O3B13_26255 [Planctomycetota bacterium]|nr:hypothetical protein [Planctomycetota bacterium]
MLPAAGECCVFCAFGDVPCICIQEARAAGEVDDLPRTD